MPRWLSSLYNYVYDQVYPPGLGSTYGFRWVPGQPVPTTYEIYPPRQNLAPGIHVVFVANMLSNGFDFTDHAGAGAVYPIPGATSAAMTALSARVRASAPQQEADEFTNATQQRFREIDGFFTYTALCLSLINRTAAGGALITAIQNGAFAVTIQPDMGVNQTFRGSAQALNELARALTRYRNNGPTPRELIDRCVQQHYAHIGGQLARYNQLAADLNAMPLYSLFLGAFPANFLNTNLRFRGRVVTGQNLMNWVSPGPFGAFDVEMHRQTTVQGVRVSEYLLLALIILLSAESPHGTGAQPGISFFVQNRNDNVIGSPDFRPPAVGLTHELMHALHYIRGSALGAEQGEFSTTAAEMSFAGLGAFAGDPITENAIRNQWGTIPVGVLDASNTWAPPGPQPRTIYETPVPPDTPATMRAHFGAI